MTRSNDWQIIPFVIAAGMFLGLIAGVVQGRAAERPPKLPRGTPEAAGMSAARLAEIDAVVAEGLAQGRMPGCVVLVGRQGQVVFEKAYGSRQTDPPGPMALNTVFDLASLTKPVATATSVMQLVEAGKIRLRDPVATHIPEFAQHGKDSITIQDLLLHQGGLIADNPLSDYQQGHEEAWRRIFALHPIAEPGTRFVYSDVGFLVLGEVVRRVSGQDVQSFSREHLFGPLNMEETGYLPAPPLQARCAPTEKRDDHWMQGEVHDPRAHLLGGVAGHAGLFGTADDLAVYAQMMLDQGSYRDVRVLSSQSVSRMTRPHAVSSGLRGLGWDIDTGYSINRGELLSDRAFGHGGFTGTVLWIDPELDLFFIFLSNRVHPHGKGLVNPLAGRIGTIVAAAMTEPTGPATVALAAASSRPRPAAPPREVLTGIDVLARDKFQHLAGRKVGLITNHTGRNRDGVSTARLLHDAPALELVAIFSPEHGIAGQLDTSQIGDTVDPATGLKIYSLYGKTRKPTSDMLAGIDTLVFDIQDIGCRFYTYISTLGLAMEAAAEHQRRLVVLDRPNPLNGLALEGPVLDAGRESFVGYHPIPVRHGMTAGELAQLFRAEKKLDVDLQIVPCEGWHRSMFWDATGLTWVNPSPNMRSLTQALLYPGIGLLETTNLSVGRGTDTPFEVLGAPWVQGRQLARELNRTGLPGVRFVPVEFTPMSSKFQGELCQGVNLVIVDRGAFVPVRTGLEVAHTLRKLYRDAWDAKALQNLLGNESCQQMLVEGKSVAAMEASAATDLRAFSTRRQEHLLYP